MRVFILSCFVVCLIAIAEGVEERSPTFENAKPSRDLKYRPQIVDQSQSVEKSIKLNEGAKPAFKTEIEQIDRKIRQLEDSLVNLKKQRQLLFYQNRLGGYSDDYYDHKDGKALADFLGVVIIFSFAFSILYCLCNGCFHAIGSSGQYRTTHIASTYSRLPVNAQPPPYVAQAAQEKVY